MAQVLILGGSGLIGRSLSRCLIARGHQVTAFSLGEQLLSNPTGHADLFASGAYTFIMGSIFDRHIMSAAMRGKDTVVHLAGMIHPTRTESEPLHCMDINVFGTRSVLDACVESHVGHIIFASTAAVYGDPDVVPVDEAAEMKPRSVYAVSKVAAETLVRGYKHEFPGLDYSIARIFNAYGEAGSPSFALNAFVKTVQEGKSPILFGDGTQQRCYTHADDVASALAAMVEMPIARNKTYNIGNPHTITSIAELARLVIKEIAPESDLKVELRPFTPERQARSVHLSYADITLARNELNYEPGIGLIEGIRRVAKAPLAPPLGPFPQELIK